ncbi:Na+/H+ antiporter subunit E [Desulfosporosinus shakirovi]|uniref:Na+/H+ antiporter subunit E n=1 Tax=Desulfosporosinus shakirovi TaxID=2885154 RepID=UPI001E59DEDB|nr:Na+/H+ antiporter subunit E [Desulfosporosinus sp. SRJS8]MCB8816008.1 Na+/H+ antiporter subunit E [Desulfosporosinus sp. SRJS8]
MLSFLLTAMLMFIFWFSLSGQTEPIFLILGVVSSLLVAYWSHDLLIGKIKRGPNIRRIILLFKYFLWLSWEIVISNLHVIYVVLDPKMPIDPTIVRFKHDLKTDLGIVLLANSITLTPGTVTIEADHHEFIVHALTKKTAQDLLSGEMLAKVKELEGEEMSKAHG